MSLDRYGKYVDSGVEWLGEIPAGWSAKRLKDISELRYSNVDKKIKEGQNSVVLCNYTDVYGNDIINDSIDFMPNTASVSEIKRFELKNGDILCTKDSESFDDIANPALVKQDLKNVVCGYHLALIRANEEKINSDYLFRLFQSINYNYWFTINAKGITRVGLGIMSISNAITPIPPLSEQEQISEYLDKKTGAIDKKVTLLVDKILRYQELRKSLINETVCRGLNKEVELRDSGIEWIGEIPFHWDAKRLKDIGYLYSGLTGKSGSDFQQEDDINNRPFIPFTNIANNYVIDKNQLGLVLIQEGEKQRKVSTNDLFFLMSSEGYEDIGKTSVLLENIGEVYLNSFCKGYRITKDSVYSKFINYLMHSSSYRKCLSVQGKGFTRINLKMEKVNDFKLYLPNSLQEQQEIAEYLDLKTEKIDSIVRNIKRQILRLKELRKTLINDVVTGQIRVTNN